MWPGGILASRQIVESRFYNLSALETHFGLLAASEVFYKKRRRLIPGTAWSPPARESGKSFIIRSQLNRSVFGLTLEGGRHGVGHIMDRVLTCRPWLQERSREARPFSCLLFRVPVVQ